MRNFTLLSLLLLCACNDFQQLSDSGKGAFEPSLAIINNTAIVVWNDNRHGADEIYLRIVDSNLSTISAEVRLTKNNSFSYEADVVAVGENILVSWYDKNQDGQLSVKLGMWSSTLEPLWSKSISSPNMNGRIPVLQAMPDKVFIAWIEEIINEPLDADEDDSPAPSTSPSSIYAAWLDNSDGSLSTPYKISDASRTTWNLNTDVMSDGNIALVFDAEYETQSSELYLADISIYASEVYRLSADDNMASKYPDLAVYEDLAAITWIDEKAGNNEIYLNFFNIDSLSGGSPPSPLDYTALRITETQGDSIGAYLSWNKNILGLAWNDNEEGPHEMYFQSFDASGVAVTPATRLTNTAENSLIPAIQPWNEGFILVWNEVIPGEHGSGPASSRSQIVIQTVSP